MKEARNLAELLRQNQNDPAAAEQQLRRLAARIKEAEGRNAFIRGYDVTVVGANSGRPAEQPLFGLAFAVKDNLPVAGAPLSFGWPQNLWERSPATAEIVRRALAAGAVCVGSTHLDAAAAGYWGHNLGRPAVRNPRFPDLIAGGSSSGSAAALAAGLCDFALGSDSGGSIRIPAAACGLCSLKAAPGLLPFDGGICWDPLLDNPGILAHTVADLQLLFGALSGTESAAPGPAAAAVERPRWLLPNAELLAGVDSAVREAFAAAVAWLSAAGDLTWLERDPGFAAALRVRRTLMAKAYRDIQARAVPAGLKLPPQLRALGLLSRRLSHNEITAAENLRQELQESCGALLADSCYLVTPVLPCRPSPAAVARREKTDQPLNYFLPLANVAGLAVLSLPLPIKVGPWPLAIQIIGRDTKRLLQLRV